MVLLFFPAPVTLPQPATCYLTQASLELKAARCSGLLPSQCVLRVPIVLFLAISTDTGTDLLVNSPKYLEMVPSSA